MYYAISLCYRKICNVKSDENVRLCLDMFNCDDVDTMLMKRKQKFFDSYEHLDNLLCQIGLTMSCNCNQADHYFYYYLLFFFYYLITSCVVLLS